MFLIKFGWTPRAASSSKRVGLEGVVASLSEAAGCSEATASVAAEYHLGERALSLVVACRVDCEERMDDWRSEGVWRARKGAVATRSWAHRLKLCLHMIKSEKTNQQELRRGILKKECT